MDTDYSGPFAAVAVMAERDISIGEDLMLDGARRFELGSSHELITHARTHARARTRTRIRTNTLARTN